MQLLGLLYFQFIFCIRFCYGDSDTSSIHGIYTAVSPKTLRANSFYNVSLAIEKSNISDTIPTAFILSVNCSNLIYKNKPVLLKPGTSAVGTIQIEEIPKDKEYCNFTISRLTSGVTFEDFVIIYVNRKESSVLVQTDKPIYKPGETVYFRVVLLDRNLRPIDGQTVNITIYDPQKNIIKYWKEAIVNTGLLSSKIILSNEPNLGDWKIEASYKNEKLERTFTVDQYVLPKFKVEIKLPPYVTINSSDIVVEIRATYTYGKGVTGNCTVRLSEYNYYNQDEQIKISKTLSFTNGVALFEFNILKELGLHPFNYEKMFTFDATVIESVTGREQNGSSTIKMYKHAYKIETINQQESTKPGFPVLFNFKVSTQDGIPITDNRPDALQIAHGYSYDNEHSYFNSSIPLNGIVKLKVQAPSNELISPTQIIVTYKDLTTHFYPPMKIISSSKTYMQTVLQTKTPKFGVPIEVLLAANKPFNTMNYVVFSRGHILDFKKFEDLPEKTELTFNFTIPIGKGGPEATLIVYGVFPNSKEIIADSITVTFGPVPLNNYLNISLSKNKIEPGQNMTLHLTSKTDSIIAIKAIDQSVLLLKDESDINEEAIQNEINRDNQENEKHHTWGGSSTFQIFEKAGLVLMTNGKFEKERDQNPEEDQEYETQPESLAQEEDVQLGDSNSQGLNNAQIRVRKDFPETWIWEDIITQGETTSLIRTVPDTLTSWVITGFSLSTRYGIGVSLAPQTLQTFRPFFLSLNLPYSIVKREVFPLQVLVHNYLEQNTTNAEITLENKEGHFDFVDDKEKGSPSVTKTVEIVNGDVSSVTFVIVPTKFGILKLDVKGVTSIAGDALSQPLIVKPPGHKETRNAAILLDLRSGQPVENQTLTAEFPETRVPDADIIKISVIGDLLGASVTNLDKLIQLPTGCGEQNMLNFVPDIVILDYLKALDTLTPEIKSKALRFLESGYQRQLTYMHSDGSFSAFGKSDDAGSTWLTSFVVKSFAAAAKHITIDENIINHGVDFLIRQQQKDGEFIELGRVIHSDIQGGSSGSGLALTSYVVLSLTEVSKIYPEINPKVSDAIKKGLDYITIKYPAAVKNPYALNLASYTLNLANHEKKDEIFNLVEQQAKFKGDLKFWEKTDKEEVIPKDNATVYLEAKKIPQYWHPKMKPVSVEMTSYALLTYLIREKVTESIPIGRWLLKQRNPEGGFLSTQDTVVGLTALAKFALVTRSPNSDLKIQAVYDGKTQDIAVNKENSLVLQEFFIPGTSHSVEFKAQGKGTALAQLSWSYYVEGPALSTFDLKVEVLKHETPGTMPLRICNSFISPVASNMAVMEIHLPSGYYFDGEAVSEVLKGENVRRHELEEADTKLNIYFDSFSNATSCLSVSANRVFQVANPANASVFVYDYYDNTRRGIAFYEPPQFSICDICSNEETCKVSNCVSG